VPGQVVSREILAFMRALDVSEIHGYRPTSACASSPTRRLPLLAAEKLPDAAE
jgi:arginine decarboxylase